MPNPMGWLDRIIHGKNARYLAMTIAFVLLLSFMQPGPHAQSNQSGGAGSNASVGTSGAAVPGSIAYIGLNNAGNSIGATGDSAGNMNTDQEKIVGTTVDVNSGNKSPGTQRVVLATDQPSLTNAMPVTINAGTNLIGKVQLPTACGTTPVDSGFTANIATSTGTDIETSATCVFTLYVANNTSSAVTLTVKDKAGTPNTYVNNFSITGNSNIVFQFWGMKFTGGITLIAGTATALQAQVVGVQ